MTQTLSAADVARMVERTEAAAYADLLRAAPAPWGCVAEERASGSLLMAPALDILLFNRVIGSGVAESAREEEVRTAVERYRAAGVRNYGVQLSPSATPTDIAQWLERCGLAAGDRWSKVYRPAGPVAHPPTDLRISPAGPEQADAFAAVTTAGFGMPPQLRPWIASTVGRPRWRQYLAWDGDEAVAAGALFVDGEIGWLGVASTLPSARRRGAQGALMARRLEDGAAAGCRWFVTETGEDLVSRPNPSFHNMMRAGFVLAYHRPNFLPQRG